MANTVLVKMQCIDVKPGIQGNTEDVRLLQINTDDTTQDNTVVGNQRERQPKDELHLAIWNEVGKGQFKVGQNYKVSFTEVT